MDRSKEFFDLVGYPSTGVDATRSINFVANYSYNNDESDVKGEGKCEGENSLDGQTKQLLVEKNDNSASSSSTSSLFIEKASESLVELENCFQNLKKHYSGYIDYHTMLPDSYCKCKIRSDEERKQIDTTIASYLASAAANIQELNRFIETYQQDLEKVMNTQTEQHFKLIITFLLSRFSGLNKIFERMQKLHTKNSVNPFRLYQSFSNNSYSNNYNASVDEGNVSNLLSGGGDKSNATNSIDSEDKMKGKKTVMMKETNDFANRYIAEIAPMKTMKRYESIADKHKKQLMAEAKHLKERFTEDMQDASTLESTVNGIAGMLSEFVSLLDDQGENVTGIGEISKAVTTSVKQSDEELALTIARTKSHQSSMVILVLGLALTLLLLDAISD